MITRRDFLLIRWNKKYSYDKNCSQPEPIEADSEEEKVQGHHRLCNWHWDWHSCNCGAFNERDAYER